jgi:acyl dehydratase
MAEGDEGGRDGRLYLEDFHVGQRFSSATHRIDAAQIKAFARQFDPQPFHLDEEAAKSTLFGRPVASGWYTAAIRMRLQVESVTLAPLMSAPIRLLRALLRGSGETR